MESIAKELHRKNRVIDALLDQITCLESEVGRLAETLTEIQQNEDN
jgi:prefoldin subunit 5